MYHYPHETNLASMLLEIQVILRWHPSVQALMVHFFSLINTVCFVLLPRGFSHEYEPQVPQKYRIPSSKVATDTMAHSETSYTKYLLNL